MSYTKQTWRDQESGGTPITADRLNHMEAGIGGANDAWDSISYDTGWVKQWYVAGKIDVRARRIGHTVTVRGESYGGWVVPNGRYDGMTTIQTDMRPSIDIPFDFHASGGAKTGAAAHVGTDGVIEMYCATDGLNYWGFSVTYLV